MNWTKLWNVQNFYMPNNSIYIQIPTLTVINMHPQAFVCCGGTLVAFCRVWKLIFSLAVFWPERFLLKFHCFCSVLKSTFLENPVQECQGVALWSMCLIRRLFFFAWTWRQEHTHIWYPPFNRWVNHAEKNITKGPLKGWDHSRKRGVKNYPSVLSNPCTSPHLNALFSWTPRKSSDSMRF